MLRPMAVPRLRLPPQLRSAAVGIAKAASPCRPFQTCTTTTTTATTTTTTPLDPNPNPSENCPTSNLNPAINSFQLSSHFRRNFFPRHSVPSSSFTTTATTTTTASPFPCHSRLRLFATMAAPKEFSLLCLENPLLDIQAKGDQALLDKYGVKANDAILAEEKHKPLYEDLLTNYDAKLIAGGAAQNTARGAQYMLPPNSVVYLGGAGDDKYSAILHDAVKAAGLRVEYRVEPNVPTGRCGAIITGHNRSLVTDLGAANHYGLDHLKRDDIWQLVKNADLYYVGGFHFTVCTPAIMTLGEEAAANNKTFVVNLSAPFIAEFFKDQLDESSKYWDYIICNESEAEAYANSHKLSCAPTDVVAIAKHLANLPKANDKRKRRAVITQGTEPTIVATQGEDDVQQFPVHAIAPEQINDTNGAGDAFAGGFMAGLTQGKSLAECVNMGQWLARLSIQELGPSYPFPKQTYTSSQ